MSIDRDVARVGLEIGAVKLRPDDPFTWASGFKMPIYNDNRMFLAKSDHRRLIADGFLELAMKHPLVRWYGVAGTSTAGISPATTFADLTESPLIYVRDKPKDHGLKNQIEGIDAELGLGGKKYLLIEDLISTGGSSARAVQAIRDAGGTCRYCFSIFNYGFSEAVRAFEELDPRCEVRSILTYDTLLEVAKEVGSITSEQAKMLTEWRKDPFGWGEAHGFLKVER